MNAKNVNDMKEEELRRRLKACQEFEGWKLRKVKSVFDFYAYYFVRFENKKEVEQDHGGDSWSWGKDSLISYNDDYNRLMELVERIEKYTNIGVSIYNNKCSVIINKQFKTNESDSKKEAIFITASDFCLFWCESNNIKIS